MPDRGDAVGQGVDAEDGADDGDQGGEQHLEHVGGVGPEQRLQRGGGHLVVLLLLLEGRAFVQGATDPPADEHHDRAEQERDPPPPGQQLLLRQRGDRDEDRGGQDVAALGAGQGEAGEERPPVGRGVLQRGGARAGLLAGHREALADPEHQQQNRCGETDLVVGGQHADQERGEAHAEQSDEQDGLSADGVAQVAHDERADRAGHVGDAEGGQRRDSGGGGVAGREEDLREDQRGRCAVDEEVVVLQCAADPGADRGLPRCLAAAVPRFQHGVRHRAHQGRMLCSRSSSLTCGCLRKSLEQSVITVQYQC